jgi:hypothetical protein
MYLRQIELNKIYLVSRITSPTINVAVLNINDKTVHFERSWHINLVSSQLKAIEQSGGKK